jgi:hypothetical protein
MSERSEAIRKLSRKSMADLVGMLINASYDLRYKAGYINGDDYAEWSADIGHEIPKIIGAMAIKRNAGGDLAFLMEILSGPVCAEMLEGNTSMCANPVAEWDDVCPKHHYTNAAEHGWCISPGRNAPRACRDTPVSVMGRCKEHMRECPVIKVNGELCGRYNCKVKAHRSKQDALLD